MVANSFRPELHPVPQNLAVVPIERLRDVRKVGVLGLPVPVQFEREMHPRRYRIRYLQPRQLRMLH